jgi:hypothetical protein
VTVSRTVELVVDREEPRIVVLVDEKTKSELVDVTVVPELARLVVGAESGVVEPVAEEAREAELVVVAKTPGLVDPVFVVDAAVAEPKVVEAAAIVKPGPGSGTMASWP